MKREIEDSGKAASKSGGQSQASCVVDIIARLEAASGGALELDVQIAEYLGYEHKWDTAGDDAFIGARREPGDERPIVCDLCPRYTRSLDAAQSLVPEGAEYTISTLYGAAAVELPLNFHNQEAEYVRRPDGNVILAFVTACLRARAALTTHPVSGDTPSE